MPSTGGMLKRFRLRVWLDDRPGALGAVASRIGSVKGDLVGIEILERGGGRVVDDLIVEIDSEALIDLMVREIMEVDGVDVEYVKPAGELEGEGALMSLRLAAELASYRSLDEKAKALTEFLYFNMNATWATVVHLDNSEEIFALGNSPRTEWVVAFVLGSAYDEGVGSDQLLNAPKDLAWAFIDSGRRAFAIGRMDHPFRDSERQQILYLAKVLASQLRVEEIGR